MCVLLSCLYRITFHILWLHYMLLVLMWKFALRSLNLSAPAQKRHSCHWGCRCRYLLHRRQCADNRSRYQAPKPRCRRLHTKYWHVRKIRRRHHGRHVPLQVTQASHNASRTHFPQPKRVEVPPILHTRLTPMSIGRR